MGEGTVFVAGAGPAGLFAARKIAAAGYQVAIFNRDIRPGGLAEYGIYPVKHHMKSGLRKQFAKILAMPNVRYFGNVTVGTQGLLTVDSLAAWQPDAIVFAVGAQGTKKLGLPGEDCSGVYSAKDFVYYYNRLPPFSTQDFSTGRRVAVIGMGNVMVDIVRWLLIDQPGDKPEEVTVIARRGPFEVKFDSKEFDYVESYLDRKLFRDELKRVAEAVAAAGQDVSKVEETAFPWIKTEPEVAQQSKLTFRFLSSPVEIIPSESGRIGRLKVVANALVRAGEDTKARATDQQTDLDFDTLIFAIGDVADPSLGLPYANNTYVCNPDCATSDCGAYQVFDSASGNILHGLYLVGWARKASEGLVGKARFDAEHGCEHVLKFLEGKPDRSSQDLDEVYRELCVEGTAIVTKEEVTRLQEAESQAGQALNNPEFRYATNAEMLQAMHAEVLV
ncbi:MAG TPA: FAD-dependent oxidoreductase [Terriglobia bacterium]|nr:FAD-dependent oxidoreductase [Terriglobia bacterium]